MLCDSGTETPEVIGGLATSSVSESCSQSRVMLTLGFLQKDDLGIGAEVLPGQDHLLAAQDGAAVHVLLLHHGKLVCRALSCKRRTEGETRNDQQKEKEKG